MQLFISFVVLTGLASVDSRAPSSGKHCDTDDDCDVGYACLPPGKSNSTKSQYKCQPVEEQLSTPISCVSEPCYSGGTCIGGIFQCQCPIGPQCESSSCGENFTGPSGIITSPNFPSRYDNNEDIWYHICVSAGSGMELEMTRFEVESNYDKVDIYDECNGTLLTSFSGMSSMHLLFWKNIVRSSCNSIAVHFTTDTSVAFGGFELVYREDAVDECGSNPCPGGKSCVSKMDTYYCYCECGPTTDSSCENGTLCDSDPCYNGGTCIDISFGYHCNCPIGFAGQHCEFTCGENFYANSGNFSTPGYTVAYSNNLECAWFITNPTGSPFSVRFTGDLGNNDYDCSQVVYWVTQTLNSNPLCGLAVQLSLCTGYTDYNFNEASNTQLLVRFSRKGNVTYPGIHAYFHTGL